MGTWFEAQVDRKISETQVIEVLTLSVKFFNRLLLSELGKLTLAQSSNFAEIELKSLILAQIERWRHALHMQVERQHGGNPGGEWRTGE